jgi:hypothetical protein
MAITGIEHDMAVTQSFAPQAQQQFQCNFPFGPECQCFRHARRPAAFWVIKPMLGHKQLAIDQGAGAIPHQGSKHADLAVLGLAQPTIPLARHADGLVPFFANADSSKTSAAPWPKWALASTISCCLTSARDQFDSLSM